MKKKLLSSLSISASLLFVFFGAGCSGTSHMTFSVSSGQIPPEFNGFNDTLLVIKNPMDWGYDKYLRRNFKENYRGPYKIISAGDLKRYPPEQYRYVFDNRTNYSTKTTTTYTPVTAGGHVQNGASMSSTHSFTYASSDAFTVTDRINNKSYTTQSSAFYSKLMRAYVQALESERSKQ
jgi:hypothetical protein